MCCGVCTRWSFSNLALYCGVLGLWNFSKFSYVCDCAYCNDKINSLPVLERLTFFCKLFMGIFVTVLEILIIFKKIPIGIFSLYWRDWFFWGKNPYRDFPPVLEHQGTKKKKRWFKIFLLSFWWTISTYIT